MAKTTLIRECSNGRVVKMLTLDKESMRAFIGDFENMQDLKSYFSNMEDGNFKLITYEKRGNENHYSEENFFFKEDINNLEKRLYNELLNDTDFVESLLLNCPQLFEGSLKERLEVSLFNNVPGVIHDRNLKTLKNQLLGGNFIKYLDKIITTAESYDSNKKEKQIKIK